MSFSFLRGLVYEPVPGACLQCQHQFQRISADLSCLKPMTGLCFLVAVREAGKCCLSRFWVPLDFFLPLWWCLVLVLVRLFKGRGALGGERGHHRTQGSSPSYWPVLSSSLLPPVSAAHWRLRRKEKEASWAWPARVKSSWLQRPNEWP